MAASPEVALVAVALQLQAVQLVLVGQEAVALSS